MEAQTSQNIRHRILPHHHAHPNPTRHQAQAPLPARARGAHPAHGARHRDPASRLPAPLLALDAPYGACRRRAGAYPPPGLLYHHQFLDRPSEQIEFYQYAGSKPMVYAIGNRGADLLAEAFAVPRGKIDWTSKNREIGPIFLDHTLLVADVMVAFEAACQKSGRVRSSGPTRSSRARPRRREGAKIRSSGTCRQTTGDRTSSWAWCPTKYSGFSTWTSRKGRTGRISFWKRTGRRCRSCAPISGRPRFTARWWATTRRGSRGFTPQVYNIRNFRVLTVTSSPPRVKNLIEANKQLGNGQGSRLFLFSHEEALQAAGDPLALEWLSGRDEVPIRLAE